MIIGAVVSVVALINLMLFHSPAFYFNGEVHAEFWPLAEAFFANDLTLFIFILSTALLALIPILVILFIGVKLIFNFQTNNKVIGLSALGIWLLALAAVLTIGISLGSRYTYPTDVEETHMLEDFSGETIHIQLKDFDEQIMESFGDVYISQGSSKGDSYIYERPDFDVEKSRDGKFALEITKTARGRNLPDAKGVANNITYEFELRDSILYLAPWYRAYLQDVGRVDDLDITLLMPEGKKVFFDREIYPIVYDIENLKHISDYDMMDKTWIMQPEGLIEFKKDSVLN